MRLRSLAKLFPREPYTLELIMMLELMRALCGFKAYFPQSRGIGLLGL